MSFITKLIQNYSNQNLTLFLRNKISNFTPVNEDFSYLFPEDKYQEYSDIQKLGEAEIDLDDLIVITAKTNDVLTERSSKKKQYEIAKKILKQKNKDSAIFVFYDKQGNFRFSFIRANYAGRKRDFTDFKRYTYYVSPQLTNKTFIQQVDACDFSSLDAIINAFSVEPLNKEFYREITKAFYSLTGGKIRLGNNEQEFQPQLELPSQSHNNTKIYQEFGVRLIGRTIFTWFLKNKKSQAGIPLIPENWLSSKIVKKLIEENKNYYHEYLEKLFFLVLNKKVKDRDPSILPEGHEWIPFLNGGLFEAQDDDFFPKNSQGIHQIMYNLKIPNQWFLDLFSTMEQYNFTIDENSIYDFEVSIDPEMLGTIFENLLAEIDPETKNTARNASGSFYTPREIVDFMVEQSLVEALKTKTGIDNDQAFIQLFKEGGENKFTPEQTEKILKALDKLKIIDPACGSGAFPMGALHKIIMALKKLDKGAVWWKKQQLNKIENSLLRDKLKEKLDQSNSDYIRKLGVIQHSIYGVDIQPIATEISKLRSFLSLVIDENIQDEQENRGIEPLPNLEFKFVTANTLIKLEAKIQSGVIDFGQTDELQDQLQNIRNKYLQAYGKDKDKLKDEYLNIQKQIFKKETKNLNGLPTKRVQQLSSWNPFKHEAAQWFDPEWMFGVPEFDIVIGNPPYIQLQKQIPGKNIKYADLYKEQGYKTFTRTGDIYALFFERGIEITKTKGNLCYITSNKWMRAGYGEKLRQFLSDFNPLLLIDLGPGVFDNATVDTDILLIKKEKVKTHRLKAITLHNKEMLAQLSKQDFVVLENLNQNSWIILSPEEQKIKEKIEQKGTPLKDWDISINYGIKTGYNQAFIIDGKTKDRLIAQDPKSAEIIKPILRGRDIKRYKAEFADLWLITTFPALKINIDDYPAVKEFLEGFKPKLEQKGILLKDDEIQNILIHAKKYGINVKLKDLKKSRKETGNKWFETQDQIAYYKEFEKEKVVYQELTQQASFTLDINMSYISNTAYLITGNSIKYLLALLNSELIEFYFSQFVSISIGGKGIRWLNQYMQLLSIPKIPQKQQKPFEELAEQIIAKKESGEDTAALEKKIDIMVYKLYDLTYDEVKIVDPEFDMRKEEYKKFE